MLFFALAAGSILYVVIELLGVCRRYAMPVLVTWMILLGIALGFATDFLLVAARRLTPSRGRPCAAVRLERGRFLPCRSSLRGPSGRGPLAAPCDCPRSPARKTRFCGPSHGGRFSRRRIRRRGRRFAASSGRTSPAPASTRSSPPARETSSSSTSSSHRVKGSHYSTLAPTLAAETALDFFVAGALMIWALSIGALPTHQVYSRIPTVDWKFVFRYQHATGIALAVLAVAAVIGFAHFAEHGGEFRARVRLGFAIFGQPARLARGVILPAGALRGWSGSLRSTTSCVHSTCRRACTTRCSSRSSSRSRPCFPATPGGAGTKQGLIVFVFHGQAVSDSLPACVQRRDEHRTRRLRRPARDCGDRAHGPHALVEEAPAPCERRGRPFRPRLTSSLRSRRALRFGLPARDGANARPAVHVRGRRGGG